ncbi:Uncharacterized protein Adt_47994 [Abeliophyllum distichum]|uniref:Uncharacterized protein n=1 Tax=Abeliophyllum distichum TaxID=126358 RepID=A0ABD1NS95_9LAMI
MSVKKKKQKIKNKKNAGSAYLTGSALPPAGSALRRQASAGSASPSTIHHQPPEIHSSSTTKEKEKKSRSGQARSSRAYPVAALECALSCANPTICARSRRPAAWVFSGEVFLAASSSGRGEPFCVNVFKTKWPLTWSLPHQWWVNVLLPFMGQENGAHLSD